MNRDYKSAYLTTHDQQVSQDCFLFDVCVTYSYSDRSALTPSLCRFSTHAADTSSAKLSLRLEEAARLISGNLHQRCHQMDLPLLHRRPCKSYRLPHHHQELLLPHLVHHRLLPLVPRHPLAPGPRVTLSRHPSCQPSARLCTQSRHCRPPSRSWTRYRTSTWRAGKRRTMRSRPGRCS